MPLVSLVLEILSPLSHSFDQFNSPLNATLTLLVCGPSSVSPCLHGVRYTHSIAPPAPRTADSTSAKEYVAEFTNTLGGSTYVLYPCHSVET